MRYQTSVASILGFAACLAHGAPSTKEIESNIDQVVEAVNEASEGLRNATPKTAESHLDGFPDRLVSNGRDLFQTDELEENNDLCKYLIRVQHAYKDFSNAIADEDGFLTKLPMTESVLDHYYNLYGFWRELGEYGAELENALPGCEGSEPRAVRDKLYHQTDNRLYDFEEKAGDAVFGSGKK